LFYILPVLLLSFIISKDFALFVLCFYNLLFAFRFSNLFGHFSLPLIQLCNLVDTSMSIKH